MKHPYVVYDDSGRSRELVAAFIVDSYLTYDPTAGGGGGGGGGLGELEYVVARDPNHIEVKKTDPRASGTVSVEVYSSGVSSSNDFAWIRDVTEVSVTAGGAYVDIILSGPALTSNNHYFVVRDPVSNRILGTSAISMCS